MGRPGQSSHAVTANGFKQWFLDLWDQVDWLSGRGDVATSRLDALDVEVDGLGGDVAALALELTAVGARITNLTAATKVPTDLPITYPDGVSTMELVTTNAWPVNGAGTVVTIRRGSRVSQWVYSASNTVSWAAYRNGTSAWAPWTSPLEDTGWVNCTYLGSWSSYHVNYPAAQVRRINGVVFMRGMVKRTGTPVGEEAMLLIPAGFRPDHGTDSQMHLVSTANNALFTFGIISAQAATNPGQMVYKGGAGVTSWASLDGLSWVPYTG